MPRCPACDGPLPEERSKLGARCPHCGEPLFEPPGRVPRQARSNEPVCAAHRFSQSIGTCARCKKTFCEVCRTRWRDQVICVACVLTELGTGQDEASKLKRNKDDAYWSMVLSFCAWGVGLTILLLFAMTCIIVGAAEIYSSVLLIFLAILLGGGVAALFGIGLAVSVLRDPDGQTNRRATFGLVLGGVYLGLLLGVFTLGVFGF